MLVILAPYRLAVLAKGVLDGLERLARVAEKELVREDLPNARLCAAPPSVPVLVDERADAGFDARAARQLDDVLDVSHRADDADVLRPIQPGVFRNLGAPSAKPRARWPLDTRAPDPLCRILAVRLDKNVGDGMEEVRVRAHAALPHDGVLAVALMDSARNPLEAPSVGGPRLRMATRRSCDERRGPEDVPVPLGVHARGTGNCGKQVERVRAVGGTVRRTFGGIETKNGKGQGRPAKVRSSVWQVTPCRCHQ